MIELQVGKHYKNLKVICNEIGLEYQDSTNSRKAALKQIECYYKLEKQGRGYLVTEKYDTPKEKEDKRKDNGGHMAHTKYNLLMDTLLINWMYEEVGKSIEITFSQLFIKDNEQINIPLLTGDYKDFLNMGYENFAKEVDIRKDLIDMYTEKLKKIIVKCLETALDRLKKQKIITWTKEIMVKYYSMELEIADEDLVKEIKQVEKEVYEEINITPFQRKNPKINKQFKNAVCKKLVKYGISSYWNVYAIDIIDSDKIVQIDNADEIKKELTERFIKSIHQSLFKKKYGTKVDKPGGIGKIRVNEWHPFTTTDTLENMYDLDSYFFVDNEKKDNLDLWNEILGEESDNEELDIDEIW